MRRSSWSHDLLDGEERVLFRRLAVFAGSFSLDAAVEVCAGGAVEPGDVVSLLLRIVDKSLAVVEDAELARYRLLDTVRQFAEECLAAAGEREAVEARLGDWALAFTVEPPPLAMLELDHDNLRAALDSGMQRNPQGALRLAANVWRFWLDRNYFTEGARRLHTVLDAAPEATELRVRTLLAAAAFAQRCGRPTECMRLAGEAVELSRGMRPTFTADALHQFGLLATSGSTLDDCRRACEEALELAGDDPVRASIVSVSMMVPYYLGELGAARTGLEQALELLHRVPGGTPPFFEGMTMGLALLPTGPDGGLRPYHEETMFHFHRFDREHAVPQVLCNLGLLARLEGSATMPSPSSTRRSHGHVGSATRRVRRWRSRRSGTARVPSASLTEHVRCSSRPSSYGVRTAIGARSVMTETAAALAQAADGDLAGAEVVFARVARPLPCGGRCTGRGRSAPDVGPRGRGCRRCRACLPSCSSPALMSGSEG